MKKNSSSLELKRVLQITLIAFLCILLKVWHLTIVQREEYLKKAKIPQKKTILLEAKRGTICDRFGIPLAINQIRYDACVYYSQIKQLPRVSWIEDKPGERRKIYPRREHIKKLSSLFATLFFSDPRKIEEAILTKAPLFPNTPFTIKENITEEQYYHLRFLEKDLPGLHAKISSERFYPEKRVASDLIGYMGPIDQTQYRAIADTIQKLSSYLENDNWFEAGFTSAERVEEHLSALKDKAYTVNDLVGKSGAEARFEKELRGVYGKRSFEVDVKGNFTSQLPEERPSIAGKGLRLSISAELQKFAEELLIRDERRRIGKSKIYDNALKKVVELKQPWIKGGAIIAMDPTNGEILALASYPRFDPNDFVPSHKKTLSQEKQKNIHKWLENKHFLARLWHGKENLQREIFTGHSLQEEPLSLTWPTLIGELLDKNSSLYTTALSIDTLLKAVDLQEACSDLLYFAKSSRADYVFDLVFTKEEGHLLASKKLPFKEEIEIKEALHKEREEVEMRKLRILSYLKSIPHNGDKLFIIDLMRMAVESPRFSNELIAKMGSLSITHYFSLTKTLFTLEESLKTQAKTIFYDKIFVPWKEKNGDNFAKEMQLKERSRRKTATDYLEDKEAALFEELWTTHKLQLLVSLVKGKQDLLPEELQPFEALFTLFLEQTSVKEFKTLINSLDDELTAEFLRSIRFFPMLTRPLLGKYPKLGKDPIEQDLLFGIYPKEGFGYLNSHGYKRESPQGSIFKLVIAYAALKEQYQLLHTCKNPFTLIDVTKYEPKVKGSLAVAYTENETPYPRFYKGGRLPKSHAPNLGRIDLTGALEQSSNPYFSILASEHIHDPEELIVAARELGFGQKTGINLPGEYPGSLPTDLSSNRTGLYSFAIGQHTLLVTPLQTAVMLSTLANGGSRYTPHLFLDESEKASIPKLVFLPNEIRSMLLKGMDLVVSGEKGGARPEVVRGFYDKPDLMKYYKTLEHRLVAKSSTAEIIYNPYLYPSSEGRLYKHTWFGSILFKELGYQKPELVVVVFLRFGDSGREGAPLALEVIRKWEEIRQAQ